MTCEYNKKATLTDEAVLGDFAEKNVAIIAGRLNLAGRSHTEELARLGRSGVPVYVVHRPGKTPVILSEVLSVQQLSAALQSL